MTGVGDDREVRGTGVLTGHLVALIGIPFTKRLEMPWQPHCPVLSYTACSGTLGSWGFSS